MKLYYFPTTRAVRPRWCLEEMSIPYELIQVNMAQLGQPEYQKLHPHGKVPVLIDENVTIFESAAICTYYTNFFSKYLWLLFYSVLNVAILSVLTHPNVRVAQPNIRLELSA
jgi:glutathione S-transferase